MIDVSVLTVVMGRNIKGCWKTWPVSKLGKYLRALQISACLTNTVKPNYEINIQSISRLIFLAIIYNNKTAVKYLIWLLDCEESTDHSSEICALNYSWRHGGSCFLQLTKHHNFPITKNQAPCELFQWWLHVITEPVSEKQK